MALELSNYNIYQNGKVIQLEGDEQLLIRDTLPPKEELTDKFKLYREGDELMLLAFNFYKASVDNANLFWWLIADRNDAIDPLAKTFAVNGDLVSMEGSELVIPNVLKQQTEF